MTNKKKRELFKAPAPIIETHCHLDYLKELSTEEIINKSKDLNIQKIVTISVEPKNLDTAYSLAQTHENVYCTQGVHPHEAKFWDEATALKIQERAKENKVVAIGEIGLDFHYNHSPKDKQIEVFEKQLKLAIKYEKPVVIHSRDADEDTINVLKKYSSQLSHKGVIHSFTSGKELAKFALREGFYLGFNGIITFKSAENVRKILEITPIEKILIETDAPFLTPVPYRGRENAPFYLPFVAERIAQEKGYELESFINITTQNAIDLFKF